MSKLFLIYIILNLSFIYNQSPRFNTTEYIKGIVECVNTTENFSEMIKIKIINAYERNDNSFLRLIGEFLITNPLEMRKCLPKKPLEIHNQRDVLKNVPKEIYQDEKFKDLIFKRYNWKGFLLCLQEKIEKSQRIQEEKKQKNMKKKEEPPKESIIDSLLNVFKCGQCKGN